jgi:DNA-binding NarL/FixJ family response regulator
MTALPKTLRALLIDDHALFRESVSEALAEPDLAIEHCGTIGEGIRLLEEHHFDIVLLDHDLGAERASLFLPAAREAGVDVRVLVVTAGVSENEARRLLQQGVSGIFLKQAPLAGAERGHPGDGGRRNFSGPVVLEDERRI